MPFSEKKWLTTEKVTTSNEVQKRTEKFTTSKEVVKSTDEAHKRTDNLTKNWGCWQRYWKIGIYERGSGQNT